MQSFCFRSDCGSTKRNAVHFLRTFNVFTEIIAAAAVMRRPTNLRVLLAYLFILQARKVMLAK